MIFNSYALILKVLSHFNSYPTEILDPCKRSFRIEQVHQAAFDMIFSFYFQRNVNIIFPACFDLCTDTNCHKEEKRTC